MPATIQSAQFCPTANQYLFLSGLTAARVAVLSGLAPGTIRRIRNGERTHADDVLKFVETLANHLPTEYRDFVPADKITTQVIAKPIQLPNMVVWPDAPALIALSYDKPAQFRQACDVGVMQMKLVLEEKPVSYASAVTLVHQLNRRRVSQNLSRAEGSKFMPINPYDLLLHPASRRSMRTLLLEAHETPIEPKPYT